MAHASFEDTVKNLLKMKPKPHDGSGKDVKEDDVERRPPANRTDEND